MLSMARLSAGQGEALLVMTDLVTVKLRRQDSGSAFALLEVATPPGGGPPGLHRHPDQETFFVLEGEYQFSSQAGEQPETLPAGAGAVVHMPGGLWHNYQNVGQTPGRLLVLLQPGDLVDFFRELGVPVSDPAHPPQPAGPPDRQRLQAITQKHHVEMYRKAQP